MALTDPIIHVIQTEASKISFTDTNGDMFKKTRNLVDKLSARFDIKLSDEDVLEVYNFFLKKLSIAKEKKKDEKKK